jgi:hypothetical protein
MWMWIVWIFTLWFILALNNQLLAYLLQINIQEGSFELHGCLSTVGLHCPIVVALFTCWDVLSHSCIVWCRHLISALGKKGFSNTATTPLIKEPLFNNVVNQGGSSLGNYYVLAFHGSWADFFGVGWVTHFFNWSWMCFTTFAFWLYYVNYLSFISCMNSMSPPCYASFKGGAAGFCNIFSLYFISCVA